MKILTKILFGEAIRGEILPPIKFHTYEYQKPEEFVWYAELNVSVRAPYY
jgi:hypothetical protein